jgi:hypothetical protein
MANADHPPSVAARVAEVINIFAPGAPLVFAAGVCDFCIIEQPFLSGF